MLALAHAARQGVRSDIVPIQILADAAGAGDTARVTALLRSGYASINGRDDAGCTPLARAAAAGHAALVRELITRGANVDVPSIDGRTAMRLAAGGGRLAVVRLLWGYGADVNAPDDMGWTPLMSALKARAPGGAAVVAFLLEHGADATRKNMAGETAVIVAARRCGAELLAAVVAAGGPLDEPSDAGVTPLMAAVVAGNAVTARWLLRRHAALDPRDDAGQTAYDMVWQLKRDELKRDFAAAIEAAAAAAAVSRPHSAASGDSGRSPSSGGESCSPRDAADVASDCVDVASAAATVAGRGGPGAVTTLAVAAASASAASLTATALAAAAAPAAATQLLRHSATAAAGAAGGRGAHSKLIVLPPDAAVARPLPATLLPTHTRIRGSASGATTYDLAQCRDAYYRILRHDTDPKDLGLKYVPPPRRGLAKEVIARRVLKAAAAFE